MTGDVYEPALALSSVVSVLDGCEIPYFLVGSFASGMHAEFRATNDVDLVARLKPAAVERFI